MVAKPVYDRVYFLFLRIRELGSDLWELTDRSTLGFNVAGGQRIS